MQDIIRNSLENKFDDITRILATHYGHNQNLNGLTEASLDNIRSAAEQAILNWAFARSAGKSAPVAVTNLQHLLNEYCAIAEHL